MHASAQPVWTVMSWPIVPIFKDSWQGVIRMMRFAGTSVYSDEASAYLRYGQVLWTAHMTKATIGIAWDWREIQDDVIVLADPMGIVGNVEFVDAMGTRAPDGDRRILLNRAVFSLDWQGPAGGEKQAGPWASASNPTNLRTSAQQCG